MKKSILMLSALLALVVSGFCLQGCSSEYDDYATEEYGYYTEEEIAEMKAIAEKYNTTINVDENYCGRKASLEEFEWAIIQLINLPGEYQLVESEDSEGFCLAKKSNDINRAKTRVAELGTYGNIAIATIYPRQPYKKCTVYLSWTLPLGSNKGTASLSVDPPFQIGGNNLSMINAVVTPYYVSVHENISISYYGTYCGRYSVSGIHRAAGESKFTITEIPTV